ncbi:MAG: SPOR domain-containing protein [Colwellia sp.]|nr:SPOR domain-containing protein [Colwellia sp.]MCW8866414.1 SPOR domain-containing protein [Colwellia sp.]MCW9082309.1 SPOR domain-containing protein [Colwellia sp.]
MSTPFQNRLVGTIIVAAAVIIFLPDVLDGKKKSNQTDFEAIPKAPSFTGKMTKKPFPEDKLVKKEPVAVVNEKALDEQPPATDNDKETANNSIAKEQNEQAQVTPATKPKEIVVSKTPQSAITKPKLGEQPAKSVNKEAWVIQLGSFKHKKNVEELLAKLKKNGYSAFTKPIKTKQGSLTKVFVGPQLIKSSLEKQIPALKKLTNVQGKVARFYPTK